MQIPVSVSPFIIALWIGFAPLYFGNKETCKFIVSYLGISKTSCDKICPNANVTKKSGFKDFRASITSSSFRMDLG